MSKWLAIFAGAVALAVAVPLLYLDSLARSALEQGATDTFGTKTTLGSFRLGLLSGRVGVGDLRVRNPEGWQEDDFFRVGKGRFAVGLASFLEDEVVAPELVLEDVSLSLERSATGSNYGTILAHMKQGPPPPPDAEPKRFVIRDVRILDVRADLRFAAPGGVSRELEVRIPEIRLAHVGSESQGGVVASQVWSAVLRAVLAAVVREGSGVAGFITGDRRGDLAGLGSVPVEILGQVTRTGGEADAGVGGRLGEKAGEALGGAAGGAEELGKATGDAVKKGLGGLLGRDED